MDTRLGHAQLLWTCGAIAWAERTFVRPHAPLVRTVGPCAQGREALALACTERSASHGNHSFCSCCLQDFVSELSLGRLRNKRVICLMKSRSGFQIVSGMVCLLIINFIFFNTEVSNTIPFLTILNCYSSMTSRYAKNDVHIGLGGGSTTTKIPSLQVVLMWIMLTMMNWQKNVTGSEKTRHNLPIPAYGAMRFLASTVKK